MNTSVLVLITLMAMASLSSMKHYCIYMRTNSMNVQYYRITPQVGTTMMIRDSGYILDQVSNYIAQSKIHGVNNIDVAVDMRYAQPTTLYAAIELLENKGIAVQKKQSDPTSMLLNLKWEVEYV